ncbi:hypothetical protein [uncultured Dokdonia sp.]|uniref:hypothetical protein n=1 Tax=uncultured Dokdonia sp. TaxID=575653 RepID=UPI0026099E67|nr:hypothetical protein [uncultured Dokdonia sp.]
MPEFKELTLFGNTYVIVEGLTSEDIIWTLIQKFNILLLCFAFLLLMPLTKEHFKNSKLIIKLVIGVTILLNIYQALALLYRYVNGFEDDMFITTYISLLLIIATIFFLFYKLQQYLVNKKSKRNKRLISEINELKKEIQHRVNALKDKDLKMLQIQSKVDSIQDTNIFITKKIEALECLPLFIKETDNMETWSKLAHRRAMMIYGQLDKQLKDLEEAKTIAL